MARLPYLTQDDLAPDDKKLLARDIALMRLMVHSPGATRAFQGLGGYIRNKSTLDGRLRELAILQVGWLARSPYEWSHHVKIGHDFGVSDADIQALIDDTAGRATGLGAVERGVHYLQLYPGVFGWVLFAVCPLAVFMAGGKLIDAVSRD